MKSNEKEIKKRLIAKRKTVRDKLDILKHGEMVHENMFNPITKHLKSIENTLQSTGQQQQQQQQQQIPYQKNIIFI